MSIEADRRILDSLMDPHPKIFVAAADVDDARGLLREDTKPPDLQLVVFAPATPSEPPRLHSPGAVGAESVALSCPPAGICILAALSDAGERHLRELTSWWREYSSQPPPAITDLRKLNTFEERWSALYRRMFDSTRDELQQFDSRVAQLHGELHVLRGEYEQARGVLKRIQDYCAPLTPYRLIEIIQPSEQAFPVEHEFRGSLRQALPTTAGGLAAIDLYSPATAGGEGDLLISLKGRESKAPFASWRIPYERLGKGWIRCTFPTASTALIHHVELQAVWRTIRGPAPRLALTPMKAFPEMCAVAGDTPLGGSLACALWGTLPGTSIRLPTPGWSTVSGATTDSFTVEYALETEDLRRIQPMAEAHFPYMHPLPDLPGFRLHPLEHTLSSATLTNACLVNTDRLLATVQIRHTDASLPVEYAMCLTDSAARCPSFPMPSENDPRVVGFSGWQAVPSDHQPHIVSLELGRPLAASADLHFATRMAHQAPITHHWADWLEVRIRMRYPAFAGAALPVDEPEAAFASVPGSSASRHVKVGAVRLSST